MGSRHDVAPGRVIELEGLNAALGGGEGDKTDIQMAAVAGLVIGLASVFSLSVLFSWLFSRGISTPGSSPG